jgi:hypothetical protein
MTAGMFAVKEMGDAKRTVRSEPILRALHANHVPPLSIHAGCVATSDLGLASARTMEIAFSSAASRRASMRCRSRRDRRVAARAAWRRSRAGSSRRQS